VVWWQQKRKVGPTLGRAGGTQGIDAPRIVQSGMAGLLSGGLVDGGTLTIASGSVTIEAAYHDIAPESGSFDNLAEMKGGYQGRRVTIRCDTSGVFIIVKNNDTTEGTDGNRILLPGSESLYLFDVVTSPYGFAFIYDETLDSGNGGWMPEDLVSYFLFVSLADALGDTLYASAGNSWAVLSGNTTTTKKFWTQTGDGAASAAPVIDTIAVGDIPDLSAVYPAIATFNDHSARHENGGADEISVAGLSGLLADGQTPLAHKDSHDPNDGSDPLDTAAPANIDGVQAAATGTAHTLARADHAHRIQHSIADNALLTVDQADAADNDYAKFTASGLEGRSYAEVKADLGLEADPALRRFVIKIDGAGAVIATGITVECPDMPACTVEGWTAVGSPSGSLVLDLWNDSYANHPPTVADTMIATGTKPTISASTKGQDLTVDWADTTIAAGSTLTINVDSCSTIEFATLTLRLRMT